MDALTALLIDTDCTPAQAERLARDLACDHGHPVMDGDGPQDLILDCQLARGVRIS